MHLSRMVVLFTLMQAVGVAAAAADEPALKLVLTIPLDEVKGRIDHLAADVEGKRLYVAALANDTVEVIDLAAGQRIKSIGGLKKPAGIRVLPNSRNVVVASGEDGKVRVFSPDLKLLGEVSGLDDADNVRLDPQGKLAYVGYGDGAIAVIDPEQLKKLGEVKLDGHPESFQLETTGDRIFVNVPTARHVAVIDRRTLTVIATHAIGDAASNFPMAMDEANHRLFVGCRRPARVLVLDTESGKMVASVECVGDADDVFFDAPSKRLYVSGGEGGINVIEQRDADHYNLLETIPTAAGARTSLYVPETGRLYVTVPSRGGQRAELRVFACGRGP